MRITADVIDDEPVADLITSFQELCKIQGDSNMLTDPTKEGATSSSQKIDKQWLASHLSVMKEQITKDVTEKVLTVINERLPECTKECLENETVKAEASFEAVATTSKDACNLQAKKVLHVDVYCDHCDSAIYGIRYKCRDCRDFDLCETCENIPNLHNPKHVFLKIRYSIPPCFYAHKKKRTKETEDKIIITGFGQKKVSKTENMLSPVKAKKNYCGEMHAGFVCDETVPDGTVFLPGTKFIKKWRVRNLMAQPWNSYTTVRMINSQPSFQPLHTEVAAPRIGAFEEGVVSVHFTAPKFIGHYESHWEFHHMDIPFGDILWCKIVVSDSIMPPTTGPTISPDNFSARYLMSKGCRVFEYPQMRLKRKSKEEKRKKKEEKKKVSQIFEVLSLAQEETEDGNLCPRKYVNSHTATPNNTPFDLTPPKSPEPKEIINSKKEDSISSLTDHSDAAALTMKNASVFPEAVLESNEKASSSSISSSESDNEFVVIPMPKCFNLSEPFAPGQKFFSFESVSAPVLDSSKLEESTVASPMNIIEVESSSSQEDGMSEKVSQETGVPEQTESFTFCPSQRQVKEVCYVMSNVVRLDSSSSSSSVSVIDCDLSSPATEIPNIVKVEANKDIIQRAEVVKPIVEVSPEPDSASSGTFPKFPVADIAAEVVPTYTVVQSNEDEERTIQVLPEGLFTGALLAAATVYKTARGIILSIQPGKNDQEGITEELQNPEGTPAVDSSAVTSMDQLIEMGFCNIERNAYLLHKCNGNITKVVEELVSFNS